MKTPTRATLNSFVKKNIDNLLIRHESSFDASRDQTVHSTNNNFMPITLRSAEENERISITHTYGIKGVWLVKNSRDSIRTYKDNLYSGYSVYNCCGSFTLAVKTPISIEEVKKFL